MTNVLEMGYDGQEAFRRDVEKIVFDLVECLYAHYGPEAGELMAKTFSAALLDISEEVLKKLEVKSEEEEPNRKEVPENVIQWKKRD
jgi:hypothetical protein|tara:strand:- start:2245 stop:2505 length:261 start_codon:yes stop_codon:yes gene_type:complete